MFVLPNENKLFPKPTRKKNNNSMRTQVVHKRKTISMHNGKRILFKMMTRERERKKSITNVDFTVFRVSRSSFSVHPFYGYRVPRLAFNLGTRQFWRENVSEIKMKHIGKVVERRKRGCGPQKSMVEYTQTAIWLLHASNFFFRSRSSCSLSSQCSKLVVSCWIDY